MTRKSQSGYAGTWALSYIVPLGGAAGAYALTHSVGFGIAAMVILFALLVVAARGRR